MSGEEKTDFLDQMAAQAQSQQATEVETEEVEQETQAQPMGETVAAQAKAPAAQAEATPAAAKEQDKHVPLAALMAEREKRQTFERELAQYREREQRSQQQPDFYQDPTQYIAQVAEQVRAETKGQVYAALEYAAKQTFPDYDEKFAVVEEYAKTNPAAVQAIFQSPNPAVAVYDLGKRLIEFRQIQENPEAVWAEREKALRAKWESEQAEKQRQAEAEAAAKAGKAAAIPPDLSNAASATSDTRQRHSPVFSQLFDKP